MFGGIPTKVLSSNQRLRQRFGPIIGVTDRSRFALSYYYYYYLYTITYTYIRFLTDLSTIVYRSSPEVVSMSDSGVERIQVNVRVDKQVKDAFDEKIIETFGTQRPYAGIELEREFRAFLDRGDVADLRFVVEDLLAVFEDTDHEKKIRKPKRKKSVSIGYRISEELRREMKSVSDKDSRSFGKIVELIMYKYVMEGRFLHRITEDLQHVLERVETERDDSLGAKGRRTQTIADELDSRDLDAFDIADFEDAIEIASGIGASTYTKKEYLPRVLDKLNFTWDPENPERFIDREADSVPDIRDLTTKPYILMNREDKRKAIKIAAYRSATSRHSQFSIEDAAAVLQGRPKRSTIKTLLREIASSAPGYQYSSEQGRIKVSPKVVANNPDQNLDVIAVEHTVNGWVDSALESLLQLRQSVDHGLRDFPDHVLDNKIAKIKYPELLSGDRPSGRDPPAYITRRDRERILQRLAKELGKPSITIYSKNKMEHIK